MDENKLAEFLDDLAPPAIPPRSAGNWRETTFSEATAAPHAQSATAAEQGGQIAPNLSKVQGAHSSEKSEIEATVASQEDKPSEVALDPSLLAQQQPTRYVNV